jgi:hypothetical protein
VIQGYAVEIFADVFSKSKSGVNKGEEVDQVQYIRTVYIVYTVTKARKILKVSEVSVTKGYIRAIASS